MSHWNIYVICIYLGFVSWNFKWLISLHVVFLYWAIWNIWNQILSLLPLVTYQTYKLWAICGAARKQTFVIIIYCRNHNHYCCNHHHNHRHHHHHSVSYKETYQGLRANHRLSQPEGIESGKGIRFCLCNQWATNLLLAVSLFVNHGSMIFCKVDKNNWFLAFGELAFLSRLG